MCIFSNTIFGLIIDVKYNEISTVNLYHISNVMLAFLTDIWRKCEFLNHQIGFDTADCCKNYIQLESVCFQLYNDVKYIIY